MYKILKKGSIGDDVALWQTFLLGQQSSDLIVDGSFGDDTEAATREFQRQSNLTVDGIVGRETIIRALSLGYDQFVEKQTDPATIKFVLAAGQDGIDVKFESSINNDKSSPSWPTKPDRLEPMSYVDRVNTFGSFSFTSSPIPGCPEFVHVKDPKNFELVNVFVPELLGTKGCPSGHVMFNKKASNGLLQLFEEWKKRDLLKLILTWDGSYVPRFVRGSRNVLSNHAWGTAFDINARWNALGTQGALVGQVGSVRELIEVAANVGFFSGLWFDSRPDPMHFEATRAWG